MSLALQPSSEHMPILVAGRDLGWESPLELAHPGPMPALLEHRAGLTLAALGRDAAQWIDRYQGSSPDVTEQPDGFLDFVIARVADRVVSSLARFERALSIARAAQVHDDIDDAQPLRGRVRLHPAAGVIDLPGPAEEVIGAIALGMSPPAYGSWPVLVAPGLPTLWREATPTEDSLCTWLTRPRDPAEIRARFTGADRILERLRIARAIIGE